MEEVDELYDLRLQVLTGDFKAGLEHLVGELGVRAIFLGTRRCEPRNERFLSCVCQNCGDLQVDGLPHQLSRVSAAVSTLQVT